MNVHNLDRIFKPRRIALIGVTTNPNSVSGKVLINLVSGGFRGEGLSGNPFIRRYAAGIIIKGLNPTILSDGICPFE